jgi:hypothetical protein
MTLSAAVAGMEKQRIKIPMATAANRKPPLLMISLLIKSVGWE